ncbi:hypothetical protein P4V43_22265 [Brevibacillus fortis]|nr:hypothetical protein [Brevibacillus fortis]
MDLNRIQLVTDAFPCFSLVPEAGWLQLGRGRIAAIRRETLQERLFLGDW